jgi:hypothetical protein
VVASSASTAMAKPLRIASNISRSSMARVAGAATRSSRPRLRAQSHRLTELPHPTQCAERGVSVSLPLPNRCSALSKPQVRRYASCRTLPPGRLRAGRSVQSDWTEPMVVPRTLRCQIRGVDHIVD